jgi:hypothetical protein
MPRDRSARVKYTCCKGASHRPRATGGKAVALKGDSNTLSREMEVTGIDQKAGEDRMGVF